MFTKLGNFMIKMRYLELEGIWKVEDGMWVDLAQTAPLGTSTQMDEHLGLMVNSIT